MKMPMIDEIHRAVVFETIVDSLRFIDNSEDFLQAVMTANILVDNDETRAHELEHNHDLVIEEERHHLKSERNITDETGQLIESMVDYGIKPMDAYNFLYNEAGAEEICNEDFKDMFKKCLMGCDNEEEFEELWTEMMEKYGHQKPEWFNQVYEERHKWCTALNRDIFSAGILSSQRSEVTNKAISFNAKATTNLFEFYQIFERTVKRWRSTETTDNFRNRIERPKAINSKSKLLRHATEVYTLSLFNDFETEYEWAMASTIRSFETESSDLKLFEVSSDDDYSTSHK
ncbi:Protein FAR1-RELATED SEQUENCE 5, partial [Bienertia sinuspersici]